MDRDGSSGMSRNIYKRSVSAGLASSDLIQEYIASISALEVMPILDNMNGTLIYVEQEKAVYAYHATATDTGNGTTIIEPASGSGRWFLIASNNTAIASGQGTADRWVDPTHATQLEVIVVQDEWECRRGDLIIENSLTVDSGGYVYVTDGISDDDRADFSQQGILPVDTWRSVSQNDHIVLHATEDKPFTVEGHLNVHGELFCINFYNV